METAKLTRKELYAKVWESPLKEICEQYDVDEEGLTEICQRLNVPSPEKSYWKRLSEGKKVSVEPYPEKSFGTDHVILYKKDEGTKIREHELRIKTLYHHINPERKERIDATFDQLIISTKEVINKHWEERNPYVEKSKVLAINVSPEMQPRALCLMDLFIKGLRLKGHQLIVEKHQTFIIIDGEKFQISICEKNRRVEFMNKYGHKSRDLHPTGLLSFKKEGGFWSGREWKEGPKKGSLEEQLPIIIYDFEELARQEKTDREERRIQREEEQERQRIKDELEKRQRQELARFQELLFESHRFALSTMIRNYVEEVESRATRNDHLTEEIKSWIAWAKKSADWYDPTTPRHKDDLLMGIDIENLRVHRYGYSSFGYQQEERNFWKPWWSK